MTPLPCRRSDCAYICALLFLIALLASTVATIRWIDRNQAYQNRISQAREDVARLSVLIQQRPILRRQLTELDTQLESSGYFLEAESPARASAVLMTELKLSLSSRSDQLIAIELLPVQTMENILRIGIHAQIRGDEGTLLRLLYRNEKERPLLFVNNLSVQALSSRRRGSALGASEGLDIQLDLIGYMLRE